MAVIKSAMVMKDGQHIMIVQDGDFEAALNDADLRRLYAIKLAGMSLMDGPSEALHLYKRLGLVCFIWLRSGTWTAITRKGRAFVNELEYEAASLDAMRDALAAIDAQIDAQEAETGQTYSRPDSDERETRDFETPAC